MAVSDEEAGFQFILGDGSYLYELCLQGFDQVA